MHSLITTGLILLGYLLGSLSSAIVVCKLMGLPDPRSAGSGNPGTTNVLRLGGKKAAAITLAGDMLKGLIPVLAGALAGLNTFQLALIAVAAVLGHVFPLYYGFKGGKGVATAFGGLLAVHLPTGLLALVTWLAASLLTRISSLSALITFAALPLLLWVAGRPGAAAVTVVLALLIGWTHRSNIERLRAGTEPRIGSKRP